MSESDFKIDDIDFGPPPLQSDPQPKATPKKSGARSVGRPSRSTKISDVENELEGIIKLALLPVLMKDVHIIDNGDGAEYYSCANVYLYMDMKKGPTLTPDGKKLVSAIALIVIDSPFFMKMITMGDEAGKWLALLLALQPLVMTVFNNHIGGKGHNDGNSEVE